MTIESPLFIRYLSVRIKRELGQFRCRAVVRLSTTRFRAVARSDGSCNAARRAAASAVAARKTMAPTKLRDKEAFWTRCPVRAALPLRRVNTKPVSATPSALSKAELGRIDVLWFN